jgi:hypothetical protein
MGSLCSGRDYPMSTEENTLGRYLPEIWTCNALLEGHAAFQELFHIRAEGLGRVMRNPDDAADLGPVLLVDLGLLEFLSIGGNRTLHRLIEPKHDRNIAFNMVRDVRLPAADAALHHRSGNRDPLLLAAGERPRRGTQLMAEADRMQGRLGLIQFMPSWPGQVTQRMRVPPAEGTGP